MAADINARPMGVTVKYNPHLWSDDELRDVFVARQSQLATLLDRLRTTQSDVVPQATLLVGARGMGKSTLLRRVALAVRDEPALAASWLALSFPEEQYTVSSLGELWRNVLDALIDALERGGADRAEISELDRQAQALASLDGTAQADAAQRILSCWCEDHRQRLLLLIDSTDLLLEGLRREARPQVARSKPAPRPARAGASAPSAMDGSALWQLRATLLNARHLMWVGASYQSMEAKHSYDDAFHDFFDLLELGPLSLDEMRATLVALALRFGGREGRSAEQAAQAMRAELESRPERLKALRSITGGNPRTTTILYDLFAAGADGDLHNDLRGLLDLMTPLYKARMEQLAEQPRKLLAHLMEAWEPQSVRDVAHTAGIVSTTVSAQLVRLEQDGLVEKVALPGTTRAGYQISERFFNIWFLMRHASRRVRQRLAWLVEFMRLWYSRDEIAGIAERRASHHRKRSYGTSDQAEYSRAIARAMPQDHVVRRKLDYAVYQDARDRADESRRPLAEAYPELFDFQGEDRPYLAGEECHQRYCNLRQQLLNMSAEPGVDVEAWALRVLGAVEATLADKRALVVSIDRLKPATAQSLCLFPSRRYLRSHIERAFDTQTIKVVSSKLAAGELLPECSDLDFYQTQIAAVLDDSASARQLALVIFMATASGKARLAAADLFEQTKPSDPAVLLLLGIRIGSEDPDRANKAMHRATELDPTLRTFQESMRGDLSAQLGDLADAEAAYRRSVELDVTYELPWIGLGDLLQYSLKRYDEAEAAYRRAIALDKTNALPWNGLGNLLQSRLKRYDEAEAAYRQAIALDETAAQPWSNLGNLLWYRLKRYEEAESAYRSAIALNETYASPWNGLGNLLQYSLQRYVEAESAYRSAIALNETYAPPWNGLGNLLQYSLQRYVEAEAAYRRAIALDETNARPWNGLGNLLQYSLKRYEEAESAYRSAIALDETYAPPWNGLGNLLQYSLQRYVEAEAAYRRAIALDETYAPPWNGLGNLLQYSLQRYVEAEAAYRRAIALDETAARPWNGLGNLLQDRLKRYEEAESAYRSAIALDETYAPPWNGLGNLLQYSLQRYVEAEAAYRQAIALDETDAQPWSNLGNLLQDRLKRYDEAEAAYRQAIALDETAAQPWSNLGNLLQYRLKRYEEAESAYRSAIALDETCAPPWNGLGNLLQYSLQRYVEAEAAYRRAIALDETNARPWNGLGNLLQDRLKRYEEAEAAYRQAIALDETAAQPWSNLGNLLQYRLKRYEEAESAYRSAIALDETYAPPWNGLGNLLQYSLQRYVEAEAAYRRAIALDETDARPWNGLGNLLQDRLKRYEEAEAAYRQAIALDETAAQPWSNLGNLLQYRLKRYEEAESAYRSAIALDETRAPLLTSLGNLLQDRFRKFEEAHAAYVEAQRIDPENIYVWANDARLHALRGKLDQATETYRKCLDLHPGWAAREGQTEGLEVVLQCHLWLRNADLAGQALAQLAELAMGGESAAFGKLREQAYECHQIGIGLRLAELMAAGEQRDFLRPLELALRAAHAGSEDPILGAAAETRSIAMEVMRELNAVQPFR